MLVEVLITLHSNYTCNLCILIQLQPKYNIYLCISLGGYCGLPLCPPSRFSWYPKPEQNKFYWNPEVGNCVPYMAEVGCSSPNSFDTHESCMRACDTTRIQQDQGIL